MTVPVRKLGEQNNNGDRRENDEEDSGKNRISSKSIEAQAYRGVLDKLDKKRKQLLWHSQQFRDFADKYPNDRAITSTARLLDSYSVILRNAYNRIENLYRANSTVKIQVET